MATPPEPTTLGEHLRRRRRELGLALWQAAERICVHTQTYAAWERNENVPFARFRSAIADFLGYDAFATVNVQPPNRRLRQDPALPTALPERLRQRRIDLGLSRRQLAAAFGVCEDTIRNWERGWTVPFRPHGSHKA